MAASAIRIIGGQWRGRRLQLSGRPDAASNAGSRARNAVQLARPGSDRSAPRSIRSPAAAHCPSRPCRAGRPLRSRSIATACWCARSSRRRKSSARVRLRRTAPRRKASSTRDARRYDVIFLDPPFATDDWAAIAARGCGATRAGWTALRRGAGAVDAPPGLALWRRDKAGQVHYHLLRHAGKS